MGWEVEDEGILTYNHLSALLPIAKSFTQDADDKYKERSEILQILTARRLVAVIKASKGTVLYRNLPKVKASGTG